MGEYKEFHCPYGDDFEGGDECDRCEQYELCMETPTADVIERSEYETLRLVNLDLAETNKGLLSEHEQLLKLRSKIDKAIEEIEGGYSTCNQDWIDGINWALDIFKRNIGE